MIDGLEPRDSRDLAIAQLADDEAAILDALSHSIAAARAYRELACAAIVALHESTRDLNASRVTHQQLLSEYRALRVSMIRPTSEAA